MTEEIVAISGIAAGGDGVGRLADGRAVFVPRTGPGERIRLRAGSVRKHRRFARGEVGEIVQAARERVAPECPHFVQDGCGGCQLQHLSYQAQLDAKRQIVGENLRRIGKLDVPDPDIEPAPNQWGYRPKIALAASGGTLGLHPYNRPGHVFSLVDCPITNDRLMALWRDLKPHVALLPQPLTRLTLRLDREARLHLVAESAGGPWRDAERLRDALAGNAPVCWWQPVDGAARVVAGPVTGFPATAFEQVYPAMGAAARAWAVAALGDVTGMVVWDLYGGAGDTAVLLAQRGATVVSVDADETAIQWARQRPELASLGERVRCIAGRAEDVVPGLPPAQAVVVNPPRAGLHWDVSLRLTAEPVARLAYLSCDPASLARDLHRLSVNYQVRSIRAFDLFPQTAHVEAVVGLEAA